MWLIKILRVVWIPLVVLVVIGCGGFAISRIHGVFEAEKRPMHGDRQAGQAPAAQPSNPRQVVYEVFGPAGATADVSYFDVNSRPQQVDGAPLPWSVKITTTMPVVVGNLMAQGDSDRIGCRITVDGAVKAEKVSNQVDAFTYCLVDGA